MCRKIDILADTEIRFRKTDRYTGRQIDKLEDR